MNFTPLQNFPLTGKLKPGGAAAVILHTEDGKYLLQERDDMPGIFYPGHLGCFGGAREGDEDWLSCGEREVDEELGLNIQGRLKFFMELTLDFTPFGYEKVARVFFTCRISHQEAEGVQVTEGRRALLLPGQDALLNWRISPYDSFALWQHLNIR